MRDSASSRRMTGKCSRGSREAGNRALAHHPLMHDIVGEARLAAPEQPQDVIGIPAGMTHRPAAEAGQPRHLVTVRPALLHRAVEFGGERRAHPFVGVDRQHPVAGGERQREILLRAETGERPRSRPARPCLARSPPSRRGCRRRPRCAHPQTPRCRDMRRYWRPRPGR